MELKNCIKGEDYTIKNPVRVMQLTIEKRDNTCNKI